MDAPAPAPAPTRRHALVAVALVVFGLVCGFEREGSRDFHWHTVLGEQTLRAGGPVRVEELSFTNRGQPVFVSAWLADVVLAVVFRGGGYAGCQLLRGLMIAIMVLTLFRLAVRRGATLASATVLTLIAAAALLPRFFLRPEMFAFPLGAAVLYLLDVHEQTTAKRTRHAAAAGLLVLICLWANVHGSVIVGLTAIGLYSLERAVRGRRDPRVLAEAFGLSLLALGAACLNPEGVRLPLAFRIVSPNFSTYIAEWRPLARVYVSSAFAVVCACVLGSSILAGRRTSPWRAALVIVLALLAFRYHRFLSYLIFTTVPLVAGNLAAIREQLVPHPRFHRVFGTVLLAAGAGFVAYYLLVGRGVPRRLGIGTEPGVYPEAACRFAREQGLSGRVLNSYDYGDYLLFCMPGQPVFIDQRAWSAYPDALYGRYLAAMGSTAGVRALADQYDVRWAFVGDMDPIAEMMAFDPQVWRLVYFDDHAFLYVRLDRGGPPPAESFRFLNPLNLPPLLAAPPATFSLVQAELDRQRARCPGCWRTEVVRGAFAIARGDFDELERAIAAIPPAARERNEVFFLRARHAMATQRYPLAAALYRHLRKVGQNPIGAAALEAEAWLKHGDRAAAARVLDEVALLPGGVTFAQRLRVQLLGGGGSAPAPAAPAR